MQVTVQQYNTVIDGLRQQLELLRAQVNEKNGLLVSARTLIDDLLKADRAHRENAHRVVALRDSQLQAILVLLTDGTNVNLDPEADKSWSPAFAIAREIRLQNTELRERLERAVSRRKAK